MNNDFDHTYERLQNLSASANSEIESSRANFRVQESELREQKEQIQALIESFKQYQKFIPNLPCYMLPSKLNQFFEGRDLALLKLHTIFESAEVDLPQKVVMLHGLGGVGKSQTALHYANQHRDLYDAIFWTSTATQVKLAIGYSKVSLKLGISKENADQSFTRERLKD